MANPRTSESARLKAELRSAWAELVKAERLWLEAIARDERTGVWRKYGFRSCADWLAAHFGIDLEEAHHRVQAARNLSPKERRS